ncbi:OsmC family protein [bacterium]|nr:OsmC family protein [bacterium]
MNLPHDYSAAASAKPAGNVTLSVDELDSIESNAPKEFGGPGDQWSPEDLLVAAVADCFVLSFRAIAGMSKFEFTDISAKVTGTLDKVERDIQFTALSIVANLTLPAGADESRAQRLLEKAEATCFITNSLKAEPHLEANITVA